MFEKRQVRVAAGLLYGGTYGILLSAMYFGLYWSARKGYTEPDQIWIQVQFLMVGMLSGVLFGLVFGWSPRSLASWLGSLSFGVLGVYGVHPAIDKLLDPPLLDWFSVILTECTPYVGVFTGPVIWSWLQRAWKAAE